MANENITISTDEYAELLRIKAKLLKIVSRDAPVIFSISRFKFRHDKDVIAVINEKCTEFTLDELKAYLLEKFGERRTPSRSSLGLYVKRYRQKWALGD